MNRVKVTPSQARIFLMDKDILMGHYHLVQKKKSNLSRMQRNLVEARVNYMLNKGELTQEKIDESRSSFEGLR